MFSDFDFIPKDDSLECGCCVTNAVKMIYKDISQIIHEHCKESLNDRNTAWRQRYNSLTNKQSAMLEWRDWLIRQAQTKQRCSA